MCRPVLSRMIKHETENERRELAFHELLQLILFLKKLSLIATHVSEIESDFKVVGEWLSELWVELQDLKDG